MIGGVSERESAISRFLLHFILLLFVPIAARCESLYGIDVYGNVYRIAMQSTGTNFAQKLFAFSTSSTCFAFQAVTYNALDGSFYAACESADHSSQSTIVKYNPGSGTQQTIGATGVYSVLELAADQDGQIVAGYSPGYNSLKVAPVDLANGAVITTGGITLSSSLTMFGGLAFDPTGGLRGVNFSTSSGSRDYFFDIDVSTGDISPVCGTEPCYVLCRGASLPCPTDAIYRPDPDGLAINASGTAYIVTNTINYPNVGSTGRIYEVHPTTTSGEYSLLDRGAIFSTTSATFAGAIQVTGITFGPDWAEGNAWTPLEMLFENAAE